MNQSIYDFNDYKAYLKWAIDSMPKGGRGFRSTLADAIQCQRAFVSQVLQGNSHFNLEHGERIARLLSLSKEESHYFLLLIQWARAGTHQLQDYFRGLVEGELKSRQEFKNRLKTEKEISLEAKSHYYSSWLYGAVRVALTIPGLRTLEALRKKFGVEKERLDEALRFLEEHGLVEKKRGEYYPGARHLHLGGDHDLIVRHHTNWRLKALEDISARRAGTLHFSSVVSISREDAKRIHADLMNAIEAAQKVVKDSKEEALFSLNADFFEI